MKCFVGIISGAILGYLGGMGSGVVLPALELFHTGLLAGFAGGLTGLVSAGCLDQ